jgi:hypothetical protein
MIAKEALRRNAKPLFITSHRQDLWRADHAHAGVLLILSLAALLCMDNANLSPSKSLAKTLMPSSAILIPARFFLFRYRSICN